MKKICQICKKEFIPNSNRQKYCKECQPLVRRNYQYKYQATRWKAIKEKQRLKSPLAAYSYKGTREMEFPESFELECTIKYAFLDGEIEQNLREWLKSQPKRVTLERLDAIIGQLKRLKRLKVNVKK